MKLIAKIMIFSIFAFSIHPSAYAATKVSNAIPISASIDSVLTLDVIIKEETSSNPLSFGPVVTSMNHGALIRQTNTDGTPGALRGKAFHVWLGANTSSVPYTISSTMNPMSGTSGTLPRAMGVTPLSAKKQNGDNAGGTLASPQDAVGTGKVLYTSPSGSAPAATIELVYGISGGSASGVPFTGWQPIPPDQAPGTYSTTVQYTLTTL